MYNFWAARTLFVPSPFTPEHVIRAFHCNRCRNTPTPRYTRLHYKLVLKKTDLQYSFTPLFNLLLSFIFKSEQSRFVALPFIGNEHIAIVQKSNSFRFIEGLRV